jgi:hypothetical protein
MAARKSKTEAQIENAEAYANLTEEERQEMKEEHQLFETASLADIVAANAANEEAPADVRVEAPETPGISREQAMEIVEELLPSILEDTDSPVSVSEIADRSYGDDAFVEIVKEGESSWVTLAKTRSNSEDWIKTTRAMEIPRAGTLVQTETMDRLHGTSQALQYLPMTRIEQVAVDGVVIGYRIVGV